MRLQTISILITLVLSSNLLAIELSNPKWISLNNIPYKVGIHFDKNKKLKYAVLDDKNEIPKKINENSVKELIWAYEASNSVYLNIQEDKLKAIKNFKNNIQIVLDKNIEIEYLKKFQEEAIELGVVGTTAYFTGGGVYLKKMSTIITDELISMLVSSPEVVASNYAKIIVNKSINKLDSLIKWNKNKLQNKLGNSSSKSLKFNDIKKQYYNSISVDVATIPASELLIKTQPKTSAWEQTKRLAKVATKEAIEQNVPLKQEKLVTNLIKAGNFLDAMKSSLPMFGEFEKKVKIKEDKWNKSITGFNDFTKSSIYNTDNNDIVNFIMNKEIKKRIVEKTVSTKSKLHINNKVSLDDIIGTWVSKYNASYTFKKDMNMVLEIPGFLSNVKYKVIDIIENKITIQHTNNKGKWQKNINLIYNSQTKELSISNGFGESDIYTKIKKKLPSKKVKNLKAYDEKNKPFDKQKVCFSSNQNFYNKYNKSLKLKYNPIYFRTVQATYYIGKPANNTLMYIDDISMNFITNLNKGLNIAFLEVLIGMSKDMALYTLESFLKTPRIVSREIVSNMMIKGIIAYQDNYKLYKKEWSKLDEKEKELFRINQIKINILGEAKKLYNKTKEDLIERPYKENEILNALGNVESALSGSNKILDLLMARKIIKILASSNVDISFYKPFNEYVVALEKVKKSVGIKKCSDISVEDNIVKKEDTVYDKNIKPTNYLKSGEYKGSSTTRSSSKNLNTDLNEDFSNNLHYWIIKNNDDIPGVVNTFNNTLKLVRKGAGGNGGSVGISMDTNIDIKYNTKIIFDAKPISRTVGDGCGWTCSEYPINIQLTVVDNQKKEFKIRYSVNYGSDIKNKTKNMYKQYAQSVPRNKWKRNISYFIKKAWPNAVKIKNIYVFGSGWDFEGYVDNIRVSEYKKKDKVINYKEDFSTDPKFISLSTRGKAEWNSEKGYYRVETRDSLSDKYWAYSPEIIGVNPKLNDVQIKFDIYIENQNWGTYPGVHFYLNEPTTMKDSSRVFNVLNGNADNARERLDLCTYAGHPVCFRTPEWSIDNNNWYSVDITTKELGEKADIIIRRKSNGIVIGQSLDTIFPITEFKYLGIGYYDKADYGNDWAPVRIDNILITSNTHNNSQKSKYNTAKLPILKSFNHAKASYKEEAKKVRLNNTSYQNKSNKQDRTNEKPQSTMNKFYSFIRSPISSTFDKMVDSNTLEKFLNMQNISYGNRKLIKDCIRNTLGSGRDIQSCYDKFKNYK